MIVDVIVIAVLLVSAFIAFLRGFIREILTIFGGLGGTLAALYGGPHLSPIVQSWLGVTENEDVGLLFGMVPYTLVGTVLSYALIFILVVGALSFVSHKLSESVRSVGLGAIDRTLGVIFGLVRGLLLLGLLYLPVHILVGKEQKEAWFADSKTHFYLEVTADLLVAFVPETTIKDAEGAVEKGSETTREKLQMLDLLKKAKRGEDFQEEDLKDNKNGYTDSFRQDMDKLFEEKSRYNE